MRHVDDGTIHAWLDGQVGNPAEAAWIEQHLRTCAACAARLAEEQSMFEHANAILADASPAVSAPPFSTIVHRSAAEDGDSGAKSVAAHRQRWLMPLGWAVSVILAVGIGWLARDLSTEPGTVVVQEAIDARATEPTTAAPVERPIAGPVEQPTAPEPPPVTRPVTRRGAPSSLQTEPAATAVQSPAARGAETSATAPPPADVRREASSSAPAAAVPVSPPASIELPARQAADAAAAPAPPLAERVTITGASPARPETVANAQEWRTLPRTEAAVQSGMALYGIDGIQPLLTTISPDGHIVRTAYRTATGELVELEQRRGGSGAPPAQEIQSTARSLAATGRAGVAASAARPAARVLSLARGDVQITLRTASELPDLSALAARLRVD
jgi:hypothetical protein